MVRVIFQGQFHLLRVRMLFVSTVLARHSFLLCYIQDVVRVHFVGY